MPATTAAGAAKASSALSSQGTKYATISSNVAAPKAAAAIGVAIQANPAAKSRFPV